jgi:ketosteroid isomerase-like protein
VNHDPVSAFVDAINRGDIRQLAALMTEDHRFIDSMGQVVGRAVMMAGWTTYFEMFPGYRITVDRRFDAGDRVALFGHTRATHAATGREVRMRAAWLALVKNGLVAEWCVFADNEPARAAMEGR